MVLKTLPYQGNYLTPVQVAVAVSDGKLKPSFPQDIHPRLNTLLDRVLKFDPSQRPSFEWIVKELSDIVTELKEAARIAFPQRDLSAQLDHGLGTSGEFCPTIAGDLVSPSHNAQ